MISFTEKQNYLNELNRLLHAIELAALKDEDLNDVKSKLDSLKNRIEGENDITLEETMKSSSESSLTLEHFSKVDITMAIDEIRSAIPERFVELANIRDENDEYLPSWLKSAFETHPKLEEVVLDHIEKVRNGNYTDLIKADSSFLTLLPKEIKEESPSLCELAIEIDPSLLKHVPINTIRQNPDFWDMYFAVKGIDIKLFLEFDKKIRSNIIDVIEEGIDNPYVSSAIYSRKKEERERTAPRFEYKRPEKDEYSEEEMQEMMSKVKKGEMHFSNLPKAVKVANPGFCKDMARADFDTVHNIPKEVFMSDPKWFMDACKRIGRGVFMYLPDEIKLDNPEWTMDFVDEHGARFVNDVPDEILLDNEEWAKKFVEDRLFYLSYIPTLIKKHNPKWCRKILSTVDYDAQEYAPYELLSDKEEYSKGKLKKSAGKYVADFYLDELNIEELQREFPTRPAYIMNSDSILSRIPIMRNTYHKIRDMQPNSRREFLARANELTDRYLSVQGKYSHENANALGELINEIASLELECMNNTVESKHKKSSEAIYTNIRSEIVSKIAQIEKMNPILAKKYKDMLKLSDERARSSGIIPNESINLEREVDYYLNANLPKDTETSLALAEVPKKGFFKSLFEKIFKPKKKDTVSSVNVTETPIDEWQEPDEFKGKSLEELYEMSRSLEKTIEARRKEAEKTSGKVAEDKADE